MPRVLVETGARLHFGLLSNQPGAGRLFGGVGAMIDSPGFAVAVEPAEDTAVHVTCELVSHADRAEISRRALDIASIKPTQCLPWASAGVHIEIRRCIPPHVGLGSGTQLALAAAKAIAALADDHPDAVLLAKRGGRGVRSALGIHGFDHGGLMVDGGKSDSYSVGQLSARVDLPREWRFVLIRPPHSRGLSGDAERDAFARLPPMDNATTGRLCSIVLTDLLPAAGAGEFRAFSDAVYDFGRTVGEYFAPVQGGTFANADMARLASELREQEIRGVGQTSWGPTIFAILENDVQARILARRLAADPRWGECLIHTAAPLNTGARVQRVDPWFGK